MNDFFTILKDLRRPSLLIRAARHGLTEYRRDRDLKRLMHMGAMPTPDRALRALLAQEAEIEENRQNGNACYSIARHIEVLIALMAEARLISRPTI